MMRISVSGVQEKFPALLENKKIRIAQPGERSTLILKPAPWDKTLVHRKYLPANEHLTMQIASQVYGIKTALNGLCFTPSGQHVYVTRRFDIIADNSKLQMEDLASVIGRSEPNNGRHFKYEGSYADIAKAIRDNVSAWMVDMERFFEVLIFIYIYANGDAHLKNFMLMRNADDWRLAPLYDLLNTGLHIGGDDFALSGGLSPEVEKSDVWANTGHPCRTDFERFGRSIGLVERRLQRILDKFAVLPDNTTVLVNRSFLPEKLRRSYLRIVKERLSRYNRISV